MLNPIHNLTIKKLHTGLKNKEFRNLDVVQDYFKLIKSRDLEIGAYLKTAEESALKTAETVDLEIEKGNEISPLAGIPLAIKDNILIEGLPATAGSKMLENYSASYDAGVITKLKKEHAVFLGKTNLDEFAMGSSTENSAFKKTKNPHDLTRVPGGSSGGSAAAVAANMAVAALGSDTGGSIRQPAAFCGVVGLKPTYGAVSRHGLIALSSSLDQIGTFTKTVEDAAILFEAIAGHDVYDATSAQTTYKNLSQSNFETIKKLRVGLPKEYFIDGLEEEVKLAIEDAIADIKSFGVEIVPISLPHTQYAVSCYYIILPAEVSANLARLDGIRYSPPTEINEPITQGKSRLEKIYFGNRGHGFGPETKRRIMLGTFALSSGYYDAFYAKAQAVRTLIARDFEEAFKQVDVILAPTTPTTAFKIGEKSNDPLSMYLSDIFTIPANLAGVPAISIPVRSRTQGLPVGFQLIGRHFHEADILGLGMLYEQIHEKEK